MTTGKNRKNVGGGAAPISRNSTFEEAYSYMQSFRPTDEDLICWLDGTHSVQTSASGGALLLWQKEKRRDDKEADGAQRRAARKRFVLHREGGKPAEVKFYATTNGSSDKIRTISFFETGMRRVMVGPACGPAGSGGPWMIGLTGDGDVWNLRFSADGVEKLGEAHRVDGPTSMTLKRDLRIGRTWIELVYAIRGEQVDFALIEKAAHSETGTGAAETSEDDK